MRFEHSFTVPATAEKAWQVLLDVPRILPCLPGASLDAAAGDAFRGRVQVQLGQVNRTYQGQARIVVRDDAGHRAVIETGGTDTTGASTVAATIEVVLHETGVATSASVTTELRLTGSPAQLGQGVLADVGEQLIGQFAGCLARAISAPTGEAAGGGSSPGVSPGSPGAQARRAAALSSAAVSEIDPVEVLEEAGASLVRRVLPAALLLATLAGLAALASARRPAAPRPR